MGKVTQAGRTVVFLRIEKFLTPSELESLRAIARQARFVDGRLTNPHNIAKNTTIADVNDPLAQQASQIGLAALQRSKPARNFVFPQRVALPTLLRYETGMTYGPHVDTAFLPDGAQVMRCDVSCTMFVSDPSEYQGGELLVFQGTEAVRIKGAPGEVVFYPSTHIHEVAPVSAGERLVLITFIESQIADSLRRDLLYTLGEVRAFEALKMDWRHRTQLEYVISNLHRMWAA
jgi:PKHD-type hydroxylase